MTNNFRPPAINPSNRIASSPRDAIQGAVAISTSYANPGGTGDRTATITVTTDLSVTGLPSVLVNGNKNETGFYFNNQATAGKYLRFDFGVAASRVIQEAKFYQVVANPSQGTWQWQGSNDASAWTAIGASFALGSVLTQTITELSVNTTGYRYYQLFGVSGNTSNLSYSCEFEFKISA
jgi:hypothetical protein